MKCKQDTETARVGVAGRRQSVEVETVKQLSAAARQEPQPSQPQQRAGQLRVDEPRQRNNSARAQSGLSLSVGQTNPYDCVCTAGCRLMCLLSIVSQWTQEMMMSSGHWHEWCELYLASPAKNTAHIHCTVSDHSFAFMKRFQNKVEHI